MTAFTRWRAAPALAAALSALCAGIAPAGTARRLVERGNAAYADGRYDEALRAYEEASVEMPESAEIVFNKATALYGKGAHAEAADLFRKAAAATREVGVEARAAFAQGNCSYRESERQRDADLRKSLASCETAIRHYQRALELEPDYKEAAENIEIVRLVMKVMLDQIKQREQEQEQARKIAEKLKELIGRQQEAARRSEALSGERRDKGDSEDVRGRMQGLADDQERLRDETAGLSKEMAQAAQPPPGPPPPQPGGQPPTPQPAPAPGAAQPSAPSPLDRARGHVDNAVSEQERAGGRLREQDTDGAHPSQKKAVEELENALKQLGEEQGQGDQQQGEQQQPKPRDQGQNQPQEQPRSGEGQKQPENDAGQPKQPEQTVPLTDEAQDILDEERENEDRRQPARGSHRPVDRDW